MLVTLLKGPIVLLMLYFSAAKARLRYFTDFKKQSNCAEKKSASITKKSVPRRRKLIKILLKYELLLVLEI